MLDGISCFGADFINILKYANRLVVPSEANVIINVINGVVGDGYVKRDFAVIATRWVIAFRGGTKKYLCWVYVL